MRTAFPVQELPVRNALTVAVNCVNPTRKTLAHVARSSARPAFSFIERSTRSPLTGNAESEKGLKTSRTATSWFVISHVNVETVGTCFDPFVLI